MQGRVWVALLMSIVATLAWGVPPYGRGERDYLQSLPITSFQNAGDKYPAVENNDAPAVAWVRGGTKDVRINFYNPSFMPHDGQIEFGRPVFIALTGEYELSISPNFGTVAFPAQGEAGMVVSLEGLPDHVDFGLLSVPFVVEPIGNIAGGDGLQGAETMPIYLTLAEPTGTQGVTWLDVLGDTCFWAAGATSEPEVRQATTTGLYWAPGLVYSPSQQFYTEASTSAFLNQEFMIMRYFNDRYEGNFINGDCTDHANYLKICHDSQGLEASTLILLTDDESQMRTHPLSGAGSDATDPSTYVSWPFNYHQVTLSDGVCDASSAQWVDLSGAGYANPPVSWPLNSCWQTPTTSPKYPIGNPTSGFLGLVWDYAEIAQPTGSPVGRAEFGATLSLNLSWTP